MNKDSHQIFETYIKTSASQEIIQEGLFDRLKARGAQAVGTVRGLGQQAAGLAKGAVAGVKGDVAGVQAAQQQKQAGAVQGQLAKIDSYQNTAVQKLNKTAQEIFADMAKLGIDVKKVSPNSINTFTGQLTKAFDALKSEVSQPAATTTQPEAEPAAAAPAAVAPTAPTAAAPTAAQPTRLSKANTQAQNKLKSLEADPELAVKKPATKKPAVKKPAAAPTKKA